MPKFNSTTSSLNDGNAKENKAGKSSRASSGWTSRVPNKDSKNKTRTKPKSSYVESIDGDPTNPLGASCQFF